jgi:uncharacterized protein YoaH (UPF0181 family)
MEAEDFRKSPIWLNLLRLLMEYRPEQVKLLQARGKLMKYLDERAASAHSRIYCFMQWGMSQGKAEELVYSQLMEMSEN